MEEEQLLTTPRRKLCFMRNHCLFAVVVLLQVSLSACADSESRARGLYNQALAAEREGKAEVSTQLLNEIVSTYPQTTVATEANQKLTAIQSLKKAQEANERAIPTLLLTINTAEIT